MCTDALSFVWWWTCCYINFFRLHISLFRYCCPAAYKMHLKRVKKDGRSVRAMQKYIHLHKMRRPFSFFGIIFVHDARKMKIYDWQNFTNFPSKISLYRLCCINYIHFYEPGLPLGMQGGKLMGIAVEKLHSKNAYHMLLLLLLPFTL